MLQSTINFAVTVFTVNFLTLEYVQFEVKFQFLGSLQGKVSTLNM